jgi:hypothetical protein
MSRYRTLLSLGAVVLLFGVASLVVTGAIGRPPPIPRPVPIADAPILCAPFDGCDILERFADGSQAILPLRLMSYTAAEIRCESDFERRADLVFCTGIRHNAHDLTVGLALVRRLTSPSPTALATPSPFPVLPIPRFPPPPSCSTVQLELVGVFNDCAVSAASGTASYCSVSGSTLRDVVHVQGKTHGYLLYLTVDRYHGPGVTYVGAGVLVRENVTGALWQSITGGIVRVIGADGRSGSVKAELAYVGGDATPPTIGLNISGAWRCI